MQTIPFLIAALLTGYTLTGRGSAPKRDRPPSPDRTPSSPEGSTYASDRGKKHPRHGAPALYSPERIVTSPQVLKGPQSPTSEIPAMSGATQRAPRTVGAGQPLLYPALPAVATSIKSRPEFFKSGTNRRPGDCRFGKENDHGSHRIFLLSPPEPNLTFFFTIRRGRWECLYADPQGSVLRVLLGSGVLSGPRLPTKPILRQARR